MRRALSIGDAVVLVSVGVAIYVGVRLAINTPAVIKGPEISLAASALPWYAVLSISRMAAAYVLSLIFGLLYGYVTAYNQTAERVLVPLLDVLQSVPILSFLPVVVLGLAALLPQGIALELASIILIFTSQAWNITFAWYQSLSTIPTELREASTIFRLNGWLRFKTLELPFGMIGLIWNSMMSWAGGWFFLMAAEIFTVGQRDFRLPGLGSYLREAADQGDTQAIFMGLGTLLVVIIALDQLIWRPLLAWSARFKLESVESDDARTSLLLDALRGARALGWLQRKVLQPLTRQIDAASLRRFPVRNEWRQASARPGSGIIIAAVLAGVVLLYGVVRSLELLAVLSLAEWTSIVVGVAATMLRVVIALCIALLWTVPVGVAIGTNRRLAGWLQPLVQIAASVPATALFPLLLVWLITLPFGIMIAPILLMLLGTQWYLLFNIIAGASAIPQDLKYTTALLQLRRIDRWRTLILPALLPYIVTGTITAGGGAWNASIVAEYVSFGGRTLSTTGIGSLIAQATASGQYPLLLASTLAMIGTVSLINRLFWRRLYRLAESRFRME